jgi:hypothetical protein
LKLLLLMDIHILRVYMLSFKYPRLVNEMSYRKHFEYACLKCTVKQACDENEYKNAIQSSVFYMSHLKQM